MGEFQRALKISNYPPNIISAFNQAIQDIVKAIQQPIRYAGPGQYSVFDPPKLWKYLQFERENIVSIPYTQPNELCIVIDSELWSGSLNFHYGLRLCAFTSGVYLQKA